MSADLFLRCSDEIKRKYLSFSGLTREYQAVLGGDMEYSAVDLETTGFDPEQDRIIEVAALRVVGGEITSRCGSLINPGCPIPPFVTRLTGIDDPMVSDSPGIEEFMDELAGFLGNSTVVAYSQLEENFLGSLYPRMGLGRFTNPYVDAMDLAVMLLPSLRGHRQVDIASIWDIDAGQAHRASDDVRTLVGVFEALLNGLYNMHLPVLRAMVDHAPAQGGGFSILLGRVLEERSGGRRVGPLKIGDITLRDRKWEDIPPLEGDRSFETVTADEVTSFFGAEAPLASQFSDYEQRDEQLEMAELVNRGFADGEIMLLEAGTGTGKSLAYLVPGVLWARATGLPVVVSTRTLNLQDQLYTKDLPLLESAMGDGHFRYSVLKGYGNYICLRKLQNLVNGNKKLAKEQLGILGMLLNWVTESETGDVSLLNVSHLRRLDQQVLANHRECPGGRCRFARSGDCFYRRAMYRAKRSHIVVVNHSLLLTGVNVPFKNAVIDEAHTLEDVATDQFTEEVSYRDAHGFLKSLYSPVDGGGFLGDLPGALESYMEREAEGAVEHCIAEASKAVETCLEDVEKLFLALSEYYRDNGYGSTDIRFSAAEMESVLYARFATEAGALRDSLDRLLVRLARVRVEVEEREDGSDELEYLMGDLEGKAERIDEMKKTIELVLSGGPDGLVRWATVANSDRFEYQSLKVTPIDVGEYLAATLYQDMESLVMTSATLTVKGSFDFFRSRVGLDLEDGRQPLGVILDSSFDFRRQMQLLLLHDMPDPTSSQYRERLAEVLGEVIVAAGGGALVLFTNRRLMLDTYESLVDDLRRQGHNLLCQRPGHSRRRLAEEFVEDKSASLFGTASFWEGVDARGSTLRLVVVTRIPFESPGKPVFEARSELVRQGGGSDFMDLNLPLAALRLKQGVGRLIRTRQDTGQILIMDSRVTSKRYGQVLLRSLPDAMRRKVSIEEVTRAIRDFQEL
ncbi:MAG: DEAD/DEAH box helicase [Actinobacteria bacterium]|nr:DEAD/DEAH box helicase [Actinomycetota bacterium]